MQMPTRVTGVFANIWSHLRRRVFNTSIGDERPGLALKHRPSVTCALATSRSIGLNQMEGSPFGAREIKGQAMQNDFITHWGSILAGLLSSPSLAMLAAKWISAARRCNTGIA